MERSAFDHYSPALHVLHDRGLSLAEALEAFPTPRPRESAVKALARIEEWLRDLQWRARWYRESYTPFQNLVWGTFVRAAPAADRILLWESHFSKAADNAKGSSPREQVDALVAVNSSFLLRHFPKKLRLDIKEEVAALYVALQKMPKWTVEGDGGVSARDSLFWKWSTEEGMKAAAIRDRWNEISDEERLARFPNAWQRFASDKKTKDPAYYANRIAHILRRQSAARNGEKVEQ